MQLPGPTNGQSASRSPASPHLCLRQLLLQATRCLLRGLQLFSDLLVGSIPLAEHLLALLLRCRLGFRQAGLSSRQAALQSGDLGLGSSQFALQLCTVQIGLRGLLLGCPGSLQLCKGTWSGISAPAPAQQCSRAGPQLESESTWHLTHMGT